MRKLIHTAAQYWAFLQPWEDQQAPKTGADKRAILRLKTLALIAEDQAHG